MQIEDLEEGEIAISGDSHVDLPVHEEGEEEQVLQPKIKRKRSMRIRPRHVAEKLEEKSVTKNYQILHKPESEFSEPVSEIPDTSSPSVKQKRSSTPRKGLSSQRSTTRESWNGKASDVMQRKVINELIN